MKKILMMKKYGKKFQRKNSKTLSSLIQKIEDAINSEDYELVSRLFLSLQNRMSNLEIIYKKYKKNLL